MLSPSPLQDSPLLFPATSQLPYPGADLSASSGQGHTGCPSPSTSSSSHILPLSSVAPLEGSASCSTTYNRMPRDQLENLTRELKRSQKLDQQKISRHETAAGGFAERLATSNAAAEALQHEMHQVTEQATNAQETMTKLSMQLAQEQKARQAAELQSQATQAQLDSQQHQLEAAADYATADAAFAYAGHSDLLRSLARAVLKGHLRPASWTAQRLATIGSNLCKDSTTGWRFSEAEHRFFSLLYKVSRQAVDILRGPMHRGSAPDSFDVATAVFNDVVPSRRATQDWDAKHVAKNHFQPIGFNEQLVVSMAEEHCLDPQAHPTEACLTWDATDVAPSVVTISVNQNIQWHGFHDIASHIGIPDCHDQAPLLAERRTLANPLLQALEVPVGEFHTIHIKTAAHLVVPVRMQQRETLYDSFTHVFMYPVCVQNVHVCDAPLPSVVQACLLTRSMQLWWQLQQPLQSMLEVHYKTKQTSSMLR